ncbi:efflux transporter outer membrane subunit [Oceanibium sediminis]|uniref:efflux transporter outer membrane subunit n=1 Tax=Oceanibium sediminis TaxID=2026339 RepID=UPI000DD4D387|nr:efflux transporter outer membrane subunit [Oceanibium sediminis]
MALATFGPGIRASIASLSAVGLVSCSGAEPYTSPQMDLPASFLQSSGGSIGQVADVRWWQAFSDSRLNSLVSRGLSQNLDTRIAGERMSAAAAVARGAGIALGGGFNGAAGVRGGSNAVDERFATGTVQVSWVLDFFGRLSGQRAVAAADLEAAGFGVEQARLAFLSELSGAYIDARFFQNSLELTRRNLASRQRTVDLTQRLLEADLVTSVDLTRARGLVDETRADIPDLEAGFRIASHRVATLLGLPAGSLVSELARGAPQPTPRSIYPSGVPADLLRNRPDIRAAERNLAAAVARIGIARADLYPSISLTGQITGTARSEGVNGSTWGFGPIINLPIFGREALTANVSAREANAREAMLVWQRTVLQGVEEVENALVAVSRARQSVAAQRRAVATLEEALQLSQDAFSSGERSVLDVLDAERRVGDARLRYAAALRQQAISFVALNVAIGAGRGLAAQSAAADAS